MRKKIFLGLALLFVAIQFLRPAKNLSATPAGKDDLVVRYSPPAEVGRLLQISCYDCHSNHTRYPWYAEIQPVGWWLASHVDDGKANLNFSEFGAYTAKKQAKKLGAIYDQVTDHTMPLKSYTWIHRDAKLTDAQIATVCDWAEALQEKIAPEK